MPAEIAAAVTGCLMGALGVVLLMRSKSLKRGFNADRDSSDEINVAPHDDQATQRVLRALPFAAFLFDRYGRLTFVNAAAESLFGITAARSHGRALIEIVPSVEFERLVNEALGGTSLTRDVRVIERERERIIGIAVQSIDPEGAIAIAVDRTELVSMESVRRDFVSNVSHELRTPLAAIKLMVETMIEAENDADARVEFMPRVATEVERMVQLVEDLLALARSESGRLIMRKERFDLTDTAVAVVDTFSQRAGKIGVNLDVEAPEAIYVEADRDRLAQVAVNLVDNALRHTPAAGAVTVEVGQETSWALLRVRDTGAGIAYGDLPFIFDRFYVADRSRSRGQSGTGLGLSIARNLVEANGGTLTADSVLGRGAVFTCRIPLATAQPNANLKNP